MGVNGLWSVVSPTARPTSLASLNRKRLAVDASIWIYQFLKAVRDKEGNALRNSHVVGFFRRICKLLYYGIKPVFVFDGGAPGLKRETVRKRRQRREGRREDAVRTAGKLLAVAMERRGVEEREREREREGRERRARGGDDGVGGPEEEDIGDEAELVYVDEIGMDKTQRQKGRAEGFKRRDQYHLPDLDVRIEDMGAPNDPRIMSQAELEEYARQFHSGEDINLYDFSKIDFESPFFVSLPAGDRYNILNAARLRSRLRMGYTKDQLNGMFPDRMAFSKFQVERVRERNELTQRLMNLNGMGDDWDAGGRIAGEKGKEYVLVKNDGVEGGWALGVVSNKSGTSKGMAIDVDEEDSDAPVAKSESEESDEFEDVEIEGLNRLPQSWKRKRARETDYDISYEEAAEKIASKRRAVYDARKAAANTPTFKSVPVAPAEVDQDTLFVEKDGADDDDDLFEDVDIGIAQEDEDDDLQRAIAMSMEKGEEQRDQEPVEVVDGADGEDSDDAFDMRAALTEARKSKYQAKTNVRAVSPKPQTNAPKFSGPLPFESLNLGQSLLGKKKAKKVEEDLSGGFDRGLGDDAFRKQRPAQPVPSWFEATSTTKDKDATLDTRDDEDGQDHFTMGPEHRSRWDILRRQPTKEVIDLDAEPSTQQQASQIELSSDDEEPPQRTPLDPEEEPDDWQLPEPQEEQMDAQEELRRNAEEEAREARYVMAREIAGEPEVTQATSMDIVAALAQEKPPSPTDEPLFIPSPKRSPEPAAVEEDEEMVEWSASEAGSPLPKANLPPKEPTTGAVDSEDEFEDVPMNNSLPIPTFQHEPSNEEAFPALDSSKYLLPADDEPEVAADGNADVQENEFVDEQYSDSDEEIMRQLAIEVEEHARFTNSLNNNSNKSKEEAVRDYENELKQLRNQQKKDRRDADEVTSTMIQECQALLRLFGLPYITAPMEAEAQCAEMVTLGLVDGIITDDSDIFLFGGTRVYKNMFSQNKFVECYLLADLEREYTLTRQKLISFAHLLGSDYTTGLTSIGPVTALEILTDFPTLTEFRDWCDKVQAAHRPADMEGLLSTAFRRKFKNAVQKRLVLPTTFPDLRVDQAYLHPEVDSDPEQFQWGVPDLDKLRSFLMATIGWSQERTDEVLVPVIRDMNRRETEGTQANITRFFSGGVGVGASTRVEPGKVVDEVMGQRNRTGKESGRMKNAWKRLRGEAERQRRGVDDDGVVENESDVPQQGPGDDDVDIGASPASNWKAAKGRGKTREKKGKKDSKSGSPSMDEYVDGEEYDHVADDESFELPQRKRTQPVKRGRGRRKVAVDGDY